MRDLNTKYKNIIMTVNKARNKMHAIMDNVIKINEGKTITYEGNDYLIERGIGEVRLRLVNEKGDDNASPYNCMLWDYLSYDSKLSIVSNLADPNIKEGLIHVEDSYQDSMTRLINEAEEEMDRYIEFPANHYVDNCPGIEAYGRDEHGIYIESDEGDEDLQRTYWKDLDKESQMSIYNRLAEVIY